MLGTGTLMNAKTDTGAGSTFMADFAGEATIQAWITATGTATVLIEVSDNGSVWITQPLATFSLDSASTVSDGFVMDAPWMYIRARVSAITGGAVSVIAVGKGHFTRI